MEIEPLSDERGFFARTWCARELAALGLVTKVAQCSVSHNTQAGTIRGLHYQVSPFAETKIVTCVRGAIFDVLFDLRPESPSYRRWHAVELEARSHRALYVPEGVAHGFQTLVDDTTVHYMISEFFDRGSARGVRWDDPLVGIAWPLSPTCVSERDRGFPLLS